MIRGRFFRGEGRPAAEAAGLGRHEASQTAARLRAGARVGRGTSHEASWVVMGGFQRLKPPAWDGTKPRKLPRGCTRALVWGGGDESRGELRS